MRQWLINFSLLELPHKTEIISALVGVLNVGNREIISLCLERLNSHLTGEMKWWHIVQVPRIMVELTNNRVISLDKLDSFLLETCEKITGKSEAGELVAMSVLLALPWLSAGNLTALKSLDDCMRSLEALVNEQERYSLVSKAFDVQIAGFEAFQGDALAALFTAVRGLTGPITWKIEPFRIFEGSLSESKSHDDFHVSWNNESIESVHVAEFKPLGIFPDAFDGSSDAFTPIYIQFMLHMLIEAYELNHRRGAEVLFSCVPESSGAMPEKVICQVLFGKLLRSSKSKCSVITYYEVLLVDSCRLSRMFPPMMARSLMKLVTGINDFETDLEVLERLAGWFAHHLSHYDFKWNWAEWKEIVDSSAESNCKRIFLRLLIFKLLLLSYQEKMQAVLPDFMLKMMPSLSSAAKPSASFNDALLEFMKKRPTIDEIREHLARESIPIQDLFEVFLFLGSKTFSHLSSATDRYACLFRDSSVDSQRQFLSTVSLFWADNLQNFHLVLDKLVRHQVIQADVLVEWLFEQVNKSDDFEVEVLLKFFSSDFLLSIYIEKTEKVAFMRSLIDRLASLSESTGQNQWLKWISTGLIRKLLRGFFSDKSESLVAKTEALISMMQNGSYPENITEMIGSTYKSLTL